MAKVYFYYSAMNAGKSTALLQSSYNYKERGMGTLLFTPALDDRQAVGTISSRIGLEKEAIPFDQRYDLFDTVRTTLEVGLTPCQCVLIDEAQFLTKAQVLQLSEIAEQLKIPVLAYGLRSDFLGEPFEGSKYLLTLAQELIEIKTICHCGRKATMNMRIDPQGDPVRSGDQIEIGGNDRYVAVCHFHFKQGLSTSGVLKKSKKVTA